VCASEYARHVGQDRGVAALPRVDIERLPDLALQLRVRRGIVGLRHRVRQLLVGELRKRVVTVGGGLLLAALLRRRLPAARARDARAQGCDFGAQLLLLVAVDSVGEEEARKEADGEARRADDDCPAVEGRVIRHRLRTATAEAKV
jgi:hypothetical protein